MAVPKLCLHGNHQSGIVGKTPQHAIHGSEDRGGTGLDWSIPPTHVPVNFLTVSNTQAVSFPPVSPSNPTDCWQESGAQAAHFVRLLPWLRFGGFAVMAAVMVAHVTV